MTPAASEAGPLFEYAIEPLPPSPLGRRWRWELWEEGGALLAAGWSFSERSAGRAVHVAAARRVYERLGLGVVPAAVARAAESARVRALLRRRPVAVPASVRS
ncbi:MAG TPA: hypothetical protein VGW75_00675 [Solirubrobacteraceae bacterium]|nr:hypothetical protein [Solirubrobacteraceae bacterium]